MSRPSRSFGFRPTLELLEDRAVPTTLVVTNARDSGPGPLRAEVAAAGSGRWRTSSFPYFLDTLRADTYSHHAPRTGLEATGQAGPAKFNGERLGSPTVPPCSLSSICCFSLATP